METTRRSPIKEIVYIVENEEVKALIPDPDSNSFRNLKNDQELVDKLANEGYEVVTINRSIIAELVFESDAERIMKVISEHYGYPAKMIPVKQFHVLAGPEMR